MMFIKQSTSTHEHTFNAGTYNELRKKEIYPFRPTSAITLPTLTKLYSISHKNVYSFDAV